MRVESDFPEMAVGVLEVSGVAAPECSLGGFGYCCSSFFRLLHHGVYFLLGSNVVADAEFGGALGCYGDVGIFQSVYFSSICSTIEV